MPERPPLNDFGAFAARYDKNLARLQPITDALLAQLPELPDGGLVLDVATGTGEPGLTLARRAPGLRVLGIDSAEAMVAAARHKAATEPVPNARFEVMEAERLDLPTGGVAAVVSRLGLLLFGEPAAQAAELARVLAPGGRYAIAVWDRMSLNTFRDVTMRTLAEVLPQDQMPDFGAMDELAVGGRREKWLRDAGLSSVHSELYRWTHVDPDFEAIWDFMGDGPTGPIFATLDADQHGRAREQLHGLVAEYRVADGSYHLPMACRLLWGRT